MQDIVIGILSDTHKKSSLQIEAINKLKSEGAKYLLHLGDLEILENLKSLKDANLPYAAVFGNTDRELFKYGDSFNIKKEPYYLKIKDLKIKMMHLPYYMSADCDLVLFGHLHKFSVEFNANTLFLNPGEVCARNKNLSECALVVANSNYFLVKYFFKEPSGNFWDVKEFKFKRG